MTTRQATAASVQDTATATTGFVPAQVQLLLTERCNLKCRHCAVPEEDSPAGDELDMVTWRQFVRHCVGGGVRSLVISGGEALLRPEAVDLASYAHELGVDRTTIVTNGLLFRGDIPGHIAAAQRRFRGFGVHVSVDGATAQTHDWMRGPGTFHRTMRAIDRLHAAGGRITGLHTVMHRGNEHELDACAQLADRLGAEVWTVFPVASLGRAQEIQDRRLGEESWRRIIAALRDIDRRHRFTVSVMGPVYGDEWPATVGEVPNPVREHAQQTCVGPDGYVFTCPPLRHLPVGRVQDLTSAESWSAVAARAGTLLESACGSCKFLLLCTGVDLAQPYRSRAEDRPRRFPVADAVR
jgi:radical SAM protein with 4Fe4S-binding SPASM domain